MTASTAARIALEGRFARELPELAVPWRAEEAPAPRLLALNELLAAQLGLDAGFLRSDDGVALLTSAALPDTATPVAQAYSGHQFGGFSPRLGDGFGGGIESAGSHDRSCAVCAHCDLPAAGFPD